MINALVAHAFTQRRAEPKVRNALAAELVDDFVAKLVEVGYVLRHHFDRKRLSY